MILDDDANLMASWIKIKTEKGSKTMVWKSNSRRPVDGLADKVIHCELWWLAEVGINEKKASSSKGEYIEFTKFNTKFKRPLVYGDLECLTTTSDNGIERT